MTDMRVRPGLRSAVLLSAASAAWCTPSAAQPLAPAAQLQYEKPSSLEECPDEAAFRALVMARLGSDPFSPAAPVRVEVELVAQGTMFVGTARALDQNQKARGERRFTANSCADLAETLAVSVSILLDPKTFETKPEIENLESSAPAAEPAPRAPDATTEGLRLAGAAEAPGRDVRAPEDRAAPPQEGILGRLGAVAVGSVGAAPGPALGISALVGLGGRRWSMDLEGRVDLPRQVVRADGTGVSSSLLLGLLVPCGHLGWGVACPVAALGALRGKGLAVAAPRSATTFYAALGLRGGLEAPLSDQLFVKGHVEVLAPVTPTTLSAGGDEIWTTPTLAGSLGLGIFGRYL